MAYRAFISYSTKDLPLVEMAKQLLNQASIDVFVAEHSILPGESLMQNIISAIKSCDLFILLWSDNSKSSEWVSKEVSIARADGKLIIPVLLKKDLTLPSFMNGIKYLKAYEEPEKSLEQLQKLVLLHQQKQQQQQIQQSNAMMVLGILAIIFLLAGRE